MSGSFVRRGVQARRDPGTRSGLHGQTLISTGLSDLDALLEGGLPLGSVLLVLEDPQSQQHLNFLKYFVSEGIACGQKLKWILPREPAGGVAKFLPAQVTVDRTKPSVRNGNDEDDDGSDDDAEDRSELRIAWQYRKYIKVKQQQQPEQKQRRTHSGQTAGTTAPSRSATQPTSSPARTGATRAWAHAFDLRKSLGTDALQRSGLSVCAASGPECWQELVDQACAFIAQFTMPDPSGPFPTIPASALLKGPEGVGRLVLQSLASPSWGWSCSEQAALEAALLRCVLRVRQAVRDTRCAIMMSCPAGALSVSTQMRLQHMCDTVLLLQNVTDASDVVRLLPDPSSASALMAIRKLPDFGMVAPRLPDPNLYVIRHKRKSIAIQMVDVDPDAEVSMDSGSATAGGQSKPASAILCAGPPTAKKAFDF